MSFLLFVTIIVSLIGFAGFFWQMANIRGFRSRGRRRLGFPANNSNNSPKRQADSRKLDKHEKRLFVQAQELIKQNKIQAAARLLESIGMPREAIQELENHGFIHDAANILMRMQRPNRAGVVYARNGHWEDALKCFKLANMPLEAARCAREAKKFSLAASFFEKAEAFEDAAACYQKADKPDKAAKILRQIGKKDEAIEIFRNIAKTEKLSQAVDLEPADLDMLIEFLSAGNVDPNLAEVLVSRNKLVDVIKNLIAQGFAKQASELYLRSSKDIGPQLMADVLPQEDSSQTMAQMFILASQYLYAGMVYERREDFTQAGDAFVKADELERAAYCYDRAGNKSKALELRQNKLSSTEENKAPAPPAMGPEKRLPPPVKPAPKSGSFSLSTADTSIEPVKEEAVVELKADAPTSPPEASPSKLELVKIEDTKSIFHKALFLDDLTYDEKELLWDIGKTIAFDAGSTILTYNDEPDGIYFILSGTVSCYRQSNNKEQYVDQMQPAETFGELWLLAGHPTTVKFVASTPVKLLVIEREPFTRLLDKVGTIARKLYKRFTMRLIKRLLSPRKSYTNQEAS